MLTVSCEPPLDTPELAEVTGELEALQDRPDADALIRLTEAASSAGVHEVTIFARPADATTDEAAAAAGYYMVREILQLRRALPVEPTAPRPEVTLRPFVPGADDRAWLALNALAFAWHPEQGLWGPAELAERVDEDWFDPEGFLLHEDAGQLLGFCWTKVHPPTDTDPALGEIYVIATDPRARSRGLGRALVMGGLDHLAGRGLRTAMLYVEGDNVAARGLYEDLGFGVHERHRWYRWVNPAAPR